jgi:hypothetical protein
VEAVLRALADEGRRTMVEALALAGRNLALNGLERRVFRPLDRPMIPVVDVRLSPIVPPPPVPVVAVTVAVNFFEGAS